MLPILLSLWVSFKEQTWVIYGERRGGGLYKGYGEAVPRHGFTGRLSLSLGVASENGILRMLRLAFRLTKRKIPYSKPDRRQADPTVEGGKRDTKILRDLFRPGCQRQQFPDGLDFAVGQAAGRLRPLRSGSSLAA